MPKPACPYVRRAAELILMHPHWKKRKATKLLALEMTNYSGLKNLSKKAFWGNKRSFQSMVRENSQTLLNERVAEKQISIQLMYL